MSNDLIRLVKRMVLMRIRRGILVLLRLEDVSNFCLVFLLCTSSMFNSHVGSGVRIVHGGGHVGFVFGGDDDFSY